MSNIIQHVFEEIIKDLIKSNFILANFRWSNKLISFFIFILRSFHYLIFQTWFGFKLRSNGFDIEENITFNDIFLPLLVLFGRSKGFE